MDQHRAEDRPTQPLDVLDEAPGDTGLDEAPRDIGHDSGHSEPLAPGPAHDEAPAGPDAVVRAAMQPANRAKLLLATAVVTVINTLLILLLLAVTWTGPEQLVVEGERCIISEVDGENALFCER